MKAIGDTPGPTVTINGEDYATIIDAQGVQRFPGNIILRDLCDERKLDLNSLWVRYGNSAQEAPFSPEGRALREVYRGIRYSIGGYAEIFADDEIENPAWNK